jgi:hypothetical protein
MIVPSEIIQDDIVKVLVNEDGLEEEMYGIVGMNTGRTLGLRYLNPTELIYKSACVYRLDSSEDLSPAPYESVMEHYPSGTTFMDLEMKSIGTDMFAHYSEIDIEDTDSEIYDDNETDSEMADFVVSDTEIQGSPPPDHKSVDKAWSEWEPSTSGGRSFKDTIDMIEMRTRRLSE